jgi:hypothetical protein
MMSKVKRSRERVMDYIPYYIELPGRLLLLHTLHSGAISLTAYMIADVNLDRHSSEEIVPEHHADML